jgi:uncharacterized protein (DUF3084 family)
MYFLVVAARRASALPAHGPALSLFSDAGETELKRAAASVVEAIRLDGLLKGRESVVVERDAQLARAHGHVEHLEGLLAKREPLLAERERIVEERDAQLRDVVQRTERLEALALEREALVAERDALLATANAHVRHLEELCAFREKLVVERDAAIADRDGKIAFREKLVAERDEALTKAADEQAAAERRLARARADDVLARKHIAELEADCARLDRALESQERIIAYRQSLRWWFGLPWMRAKLAWKRLTGA